MKTSICFLLLTLSGTLFALPADPENAALLYFQAFCVYEKPTGSMKDMVADLASGEIEANPNIKKYVNKYLKKCASAIELVEDAGQLSECDWGLQYSKGFAMQMRHVSQARMLTFIILSDARIALSESDLELAIDRCLTARKLGIDVAQDPVTIAFIVEKSIEKMTNNCLIDVLSSGNVDSQLLQKLKEQLNDIDSEIKPLIFSMEVEKQVAAMYFNPEKVEELIRFLEIGEASIKFIREADEQVLQKNLNYYNNYWSQLLSILSKSDGNAYAQFEKLQQEFIENSDSKENSDAFITRMVAPALAKVYNVGIRSDTSSNALKTAIELYIIAAQTGSLPDSLPADMPKDLYSCEDFEYQKTADGFTLRCKAADPVKKEIYEYKFKVK